VSENRLNNLQKEYGELKLRLEHCKEIEAKNHILENEIIVLKNKIIEIEKQIREQTEADLFFISAKIQKKLLDGEPKENIQDLTMRQLNYQQLLFQMQQASPYSQRASGQ
jgi:DNA primase large subunit